MSYFSGKTPEQYWAYLERHIAMIPNPENQAPVRKYLLEQEERVKPSTLGMYLSHIKAFGIYLDDRTWLDATRDDVVLHIKQAAGAPGRQDLRNSRPKRPLGKYTKYQRMVMLRQFYQWLLETDEVPDQFKRLPFEKPSIEEQLTGRHDRLTQDEVIRMLAATTDARDRAIVMTLVDGGFREGELVAFNVGDLVFDDYGAKLQHQGPRPGLKSGPRKVPTRVTFAAPYLKDWLNAHPYRSDPDHALFTSRSHRNFGARMKPPGIWGIIDTLSRRAKIRHINPHMLRHTAASIRSGDGWNEEMMRLHFGWSKGSEMPSYYAHVEEDYDDFALRRAGVPVPAEKAEEWSPRCSGCGVLVALDSRFCPSCGQALVGKD